MSDLEIDAAFDPGVSPVLCPGCGGRVVLVAFAGEAAPGCPVCRDREAAVRAVEGVVAPGGWPRVVVAGGAPLAGGASWLSVVGAEADLDPGDGPVARFRREGPTLTIVALSAGVRVGGVALAPGEEAAVAVGARIGLPGRELLRVV